jgi:anti-sigma B factor antagonist
MHLTVRRIVQPPTAIVHATGEIDIASAPLLAGALLECLDRECRILSVDLEEVSFMDCAGISVLLRAQAEARHRDATLQLTAWSVDVERVLLLGQATQLLPARVEVAAPADRAAEQTAVQAAEQAPQPCS